MKVCFLQVTPEEPNESHIEMCKHNDSCDFYFVTHDNIHQDALDFCPNTNWAETRTILAEKVPKDYDYYAFVDYDYQLISRTRKSFIDQMIEDLEKFEPPVLIPYPGTGLSTPLAKDMDFFYSNNYSVQMFSHCGMKIVHKSLLNWFFPQVAKYDGGWSAAHYFNLMEIPFYKDLVMSHNILYNHVHFGGTSDGNSFNNMHDMWEWFRKAMNFEQFKKFDDMFDNPFDFEELMNERHSLKIKEYFVDFINKSKLEPRKSGSTNYLDLDYLSRFFDFDHENFVKLKSLTNEGKYSD
jgi:hypothetical protein